MRIIHKQLLVLLCAATLGGGAYLHAQNDYPAPAKTPEEAATRFYLFLSVIKQFSSEESPFNKARSSETALPNLSGTGWLSRKQYPEVVGADFSLFSSLNTSLKDTRFEAHQSATGGDVIIAQVTPANVTQSHKVIVVAEDGGYRVDLKATYARWNNLSGEQLDEQWFRYTGVISPSSATNANFLRAQCQTQLKQQMLGVLQYAQDYDEKLPPARRWIDVLQPYTKSEQIFICPSLQNKGNGYAYNQNLSQLPQSKIDEVALTVNIYETSNPNRNVFAPFTGRAYRHQDGINLAFADGHIKWFRKDADLNALTIKP